jgi:catechol 2,3-dioxygenase-like lactoylglutathione lyase family enzyme
VAHALIVLDNIAVELMAPADGERASRLAAALADGEGLKSLVFAVDDVERAHRRAARVGLAPEPIGAGRSNSGGIWRSFRASTERTHGTRMFFMQRSAPLAVSESAEGGVSGLDHIVIRSSEPERAAALYGARLGLGMRLDRDVGGRRLLFFRCGDAIVEVACDDAWADRRDRPWGLSWRVTEADGARARLAAAGFDVSDVRAGMKPGTRVFTVRNGTCGVPTLMIEPAPNRD